MTAWTSFEFYKESKGGKVYGIEHGPFRTFSEAKKDLIDHIKSDVDEVRMTLAYAREARKPE